ncbi:MAG TPA: hypothetical protein VLB44_02595 [Kofleriaceae bacterium]|nr:hypothetical protein [Kofleriaceae bacterium]
MKRALAACCVLVALVAAGCGKKKPKVSPEVTGLAAVPASAQVVIVTDVARVVGSPLVDRAVDQLLMRDADLATRWQRLKDSCKLDINKIKHVALAIGPKAGEQPGTGPVLMVVTGQLVEADLATCVRAMVGQGGGTLTAKDAGGRTLYQAQDGKRTMYFAFGRADTVVLGSNEAYVTEAIGTGKKVLDTPDLARWIGKADQKAPVWAAGRVDERVKGGLVKVTNGQLKEGPQAMLVALDPTNGAKIEVSAVMGSPADAKTLESFAKSQLSLMAMAAQVKSLGRLVDKVAISTDDSIVHFKADLGMDEVNLLISALDGGAPPAQGSPPPAPGSGSSGSASGSAGP